MCVMLTLQVYKTNKYGANQSETGVLGIIWTSVISSIHL